MACFGFLQVCNEYLPPETEEDFVKTGSMKKKKKKSSWFCWPKKSVAKTVPVDLSMSRNLDSITKIHSSKPPHKKVVSSKKLSQSIGVNARNKSHKKRLGTVKEIAVVNETNHSIPVGNEEKKLSDQKKETRKTQIPSAENVHIASRTTTNIATRKTGNENVDFNKGAYDSILGMSVMIVILVLILFFGKFCAILCTSAWLYMIPMLRTVIDSNIRAKTGVDSDSRLPDLDSDEYKKKVVLGGLLQRNHKTVIGIS